MKVPAWMLRIVLTPRQLERRERREFRKELRRANRSLSGFQMNATKCAQARDEARVRAKEALQDGQRDAARSQLQSWRIFQSNCLLLEKKLTLGQVFLMKMEAAANSKDFMVAVNGFNSNLDRYQKELEGFVITSEETLDTLNELDQEWADAHRGVMDRSEPSGDLSVPSVDDMLSELEQEVSAGGDSVYEDMRDLADKAMNEAKRKDS